MQRVLVTGVRGLLGSTLLRELKKAGHVALPFEGNIKNESELLLAATTANPDWIVHTAAITNVAECEKNPTEAFAVNAEGTKHVVEAAKAVSARLLYISTVSVFKGDKGNYVETDTPDAINVYNQSKLKGEQYVLEYEKGMVVRLNLVGVHPDGSRGKNFLEWLIDSVRANKDINLFNDQYINPTTNQSASELIIKIIEANLSERILHIGSHDVVSKAELGRKVIAKFPSYSGTVKEGSVDTIADGVERPKHMWLNTDKSVSLFGKNKSIDGKLEEIFKELD
jgi:dTDP-4-dehydrorhamnose reductase